MARPPASVVFVARTHWLVGLAIVGSVILLHLLIRSVPRITIGTDGYLITGGLAALYLIAGTLVWYGAPFGRLLSRVCSLLYLPRPQFGSAVWDSMNSAEFQAHFDRTPRPGPIDPTTKG